MERNDYHSDPALGSSDVKGLLECPALWAFRKEHSQRKSTAAKDLGTIVHALVLEPDTLDDVLWPEVVDGRTKAGKEAKQKAADEGKIILAKDHLMRFEAIREEWLGSDKERFLKAYSKREYPIITEQSDIFGRKTPIKALLDAYDPLVGVCDVKTMEDLPTHDNVQRAAIKYWWYLQQAHYEKVIAQAPGESCPDFCFLVIQTQPPYVHTTVRLDPDAIQRAHQLVDGAYEAYQRGKEAGKFETNISDEMVLDKPKWCLL